MMPGKDGTGPMGAGSMTGRGFGVCTGDTQVRYGAGLRLRSGRGLACRRGLGRGLGRGFGRGVGRGVAMSGASSKAQAEMLQKQRDVLRSRMEAVDRQLECLNKTQKIV